MSTTARAQRRQILFTCVTVLLGMMIALTPSASQAGQGLKLKLTSAAGGSLQATATVHARRGSTCVLTIDLGKQRVRLPAIKTEKGTASWGWLLRGGAKKQQLKASAACSGKGHKTKARDRAKVKGQPGATSELVVSGSVTTLKGQPLQAPPPDQVAEPDGSKGGATNPGDPGWCTWGAWNLAQWLGTSVSGNAKYWAQRAAANGLKVGTTPVVGSVYVYEGGAAGHVGVVTEVRGSEFTIRDMNGGAFAKTFAAAGDAAAMGAYGKNEWKNYGRWMTVNFNRYADHVKSVDQYTKFIYKPNEAPNQYEGQIVQWDGDRKAQKTAWIVQQGKRYWIPTSAIFYCLKGRGVAGPTVLPATVLDTYPDQTGQWANCTSGGVSIGAGTPPTESTGTSTTPTAPPPPTAWAEQQGSKGANTFTNPYNASGMGPRISPMQWVDVSCKVYAPQIGSANPDGYWYRIKSSPWNDQYYAVANTFWNGDIPGQTPYTHNTDWNVPNC
jgi:surface antigen